MFWRTGLRKQTRNQILAATIVSTNVITMIAVTIDTIIATNMSTIIDAILMIILITTMIFPINLFNLIGIVFLITSKMFDFYVDI